MLAMDIMSTPVISVAPRLPVTDVAALLRDRRIGGVPVVNDSRLVGMVTESDLMHRYEIGTDRAAELGPWWRRMRRPAVSVHAYVKSHGRTARYVMSTRVQVVDEAHELAHVANVLDLHRIGRVPVMKDGHMVGIIARADLVRALATQPVPGLATENLDDDVIRERLLDELSGQPWWNRHWQNVYVEDGVVILKGIVGSEAERAGARVAAENLVGVRAVQDDRIVGVDASGMI